MVPDAKNAVAAAMPGMRPKREVASVRAKLRDSGMIPRIESSAFVAPERPIDRTSLHVPSTMLDTKKAKG